MFQMRPLRAVCLGVLTALAAQSVLGAQEPTRARIVESLIAFRAVMNHDTTRFDGCSVDAFVGVENAHAAMSPDARRLIDVRGSCVADRGCIRERPRVIVESVRSSGPLYTVVISVIGTNASYREESTGRWSGWGYIQFFETRRWGYAPWEPPIPAVLDVPSPARTSRC